jgi:hypothetical protein
MPDGTQYSQAASSTAPGSTSANATTTLMITSVGASAAKTPGKQPSVASRRRFPGQDAFSIATADVDPADRLLHERRIILVYEQCRGPRICR